jgi:holo-[acyl-carrier protein] synthase
MSIIGHGVDLTQVTRIAEMHAEHGAHFLDRCFTAAEQAYCLAHRQPGAADARFAGRFAAKEAILKVLGTGWRGQIAWTDMEITNDSSGKPVLELSGESKRVAELLGITEWHISISHAGEQAIASAIGWGAPQG